MRKLNDRAVASLICPEGKKDVLVFDDALKGFGVRVSCTGPRIFLFQYRMGGAVRRIPLGTFGSEMTTAQARARAERLRGDVRGGRDPVIERRSAKAEAKARATEQAFKFGAMVDAWVDAREGDRRDSYLNEARRCLRRNLPNWLGRPACSITTTEAVRELDRIKANKGPVTANRTLSYARAAFGWAMKRESLAVNPMRGLERPGREESRDRVLSDAEAGIIWRAAETLGTPYCGFVRLLLLTLARRDEVASMHWDELDNPSNPRLWTLPANRSKNRRAHLFHLSEPARAVLCGIPRIKGCPYIFSSARGGPITGFSNAVMRLRAAIEESGSHFSNWRLHDFRRAGVTWLAGAGFAPHVADKLLNHVAGTIHGVAAVYQRAEFLAERKAALDAWAMHVLACADAAHGMGPVGTQSHVRVTLT